MLTVLRSETTLWTCLSINNSVTQSVTQSISHKHYFNYIIKKYHNELFFRCGCILVYIWLIIQEYCILQKILCVMFFCLYFSVLVLSVRLFPYLSSISLLRAVCPWYYHKYMHYITRGKWSFYTLFSRSVLFFSVQHKESLWELSVQYRIRIHLYRFGSGTNFNFTQKYLICRIISTLQYKRKQKDGSK